MYVFHTSLIPGLYIEGQVAAGAECHAFAQGWIALVQQGHPGRTKKWCDVPKKVGIH